MKHFLFLIFTLSFLTQKVEADETTTITISFDKEQFVFAQNDAGALEVTVADENMVAGWNDEVNTPGLPWISVNVQVPLGMAYKSFSASISKNKLFDNVVVAENPVPVPTSMAFDLAGFTTLPQYGIMSYPSENVRYTNSSIEDTHVLLHFLVCPFIYDTSAGQLYLVSNMTLNICTQPDGTPSSKEERRDRFVQQYMADGTSSATTDNFGQNAAIKSFPSIYTDSIDYVVITSDELAYYFKPWVQWKRQKGVRAKVITVEEIMKASGSGFSKENAIKAYLSILYYNNGLKYVLLGGDNTVVPSKKCYGYIYVNKEKEEHYDIPTDLFYACLDYWHQDFFWDGNRNGINGEENDSIDLSQLVAVTRLPVRTSTDVKTTLIKLMEYEQNPLQRGWNEAFLTAGTRLEYDSTAVQSDAEIMEDMLFRLYLSKYWKGSRYKFFDTFSDVEDKVMNKDGLHNQLENGYAFVDLISHGSETAWNLYPSYTKDCAPSNYESADASTLNNTGYTVLTTNACLSNAFDYAGGPCLSESLIRNMNSGVIAFLGSSRYGLHTFRTLGYSMMYTNRFYQYLLSSSFYKEKNFGTVVAAAKASMTGFCKFYSYRWLQYSINPIGDPETPVYTEMPTEFSGSSATVFKNNVVRVETGVDSCTVCVMSSDDDGETYYEIKKDVCNATFTNVKSDVSVCITKQNYIPKIIYLKRSDATTYAFIDGCGFSRDDENLDVVTKIDSCATHPVLKVSSASTGRTEKTINVSSGLSTVSVDASDMEKGIHIVSLYVDGTLADSKSIIKE